MEILTGQSRDATSAAVPMENVKITSDARIPVFSGLAAG
jgi:hypothetical protein